MIDGCGHEADRHNAGRSWVKTRYENVRSMGAAEVVAEALTSCRYVISGRADDGPVERLRVRSQPRLRKGLS